MVYGEGYSRRMAVGGATEGPNPVPVRRGACGPGRGCGRGGPASQAPRPEGSRVAGGAAAKGDARRFRPETRECARPRVSVCVNGAGITGGGIVQDARLLRCPLFIGELCGSGRSLSALFFLA